MNKNKIIYYGETMIDLTGDTVTAEDVTYGKTFHLASGDAATGTLVLPSGTLSISENGTYNVTSYAQAAVSVASGIIIPEGFALYNGYLLPQIPTGDGYDYTFIRFNPVNDTFDCVQGTSNWRARSASTLDNWQLEFANQATVRSRQYSIPQDGTATDWGEYTASANYYGTSNGRKVIWSSHDIMISTTSNVLYKHGIGIYPQ